MNRHALAVLELDRVLEAIAARAATRMGREHVLGLNPRTELGAVLHELARVSEVRWMLGLLPSAQPSGFPDLEAFLEALEPDGAVLTPEALGAFLLVLIASRKAATQIARTVDTERTPGGVDGVSPPIPALPHLTEFRARLPMREDLERELARIVDEDGGVRDNASPALRGIRRRLRVLKGTVVQRLERYMETLPKAHRVEDASVSVRDGRYVIPVRREGKSQVGGILRGESSTGATLFLEPPLAIQLMNEIHELERDEAKEIHRLLAEATGRLRPIRAALRDGFAALVELDSLSSRALAAEAWGAAVPEMVGPERSGDALKICEGRHPLLLEGTIDAVPFSLELGDTERVVVVSGPNTGGKTVLLKALGLIHVLAQCGVIPPVGSGTRLPILLEIFADIGDEQSIAESLSTFSAHVENAREILTGAGPGTLVLLDELGTGTDPTEGAALARVVIEAVVSSGARGIVSSHLGALKRLDDEGSGIVNASLLFDGDRLAPTFELQKGRPGRSFGLAIARRLGFPGELVDRAERYVGSEEVRLEGLLEALERKERELAESLEEAHHAGIEAQRLLDLAESRRADVESRERGLDERARDRARSLLLEARQEIEAAISELQRSEREGMADAATRARRRIEKAADEHRRVPSAVRSGASAGLRPVSVGDHARVLASGTVGVVREVREDRVAVEVGGVRLRLPRDEVEAVQAAGEGRDEAQAPLPISGWADPTSEAVHEVDLRGLRVDEVALPLRRALDGAVVGNLSEVRIIHGLGTGAVKARVREILGADARVRTSRPGGPGGGGAGVTVAVLE